MTLGFILSRHVNSEKTNNYWKECINQIRKFYPTNYIIVVDDNSNYDFIDYENVDLTECTIITGEYPQRAELLPYYYFYKKKFFENACIIHDSIFIHKKINFDKIKNIDVLPLWHFNPDKENVFNSLQLISNFRNQFLLQKNLSLGDMTILGRPPEWYGCFGVQSYINHSFLFRTANKYNLFSLLNKVHSRADRCCLERIFGLIFNLESNVTKKYKSLFGNIHTHNGSFDYTYDKYKYDLTVRKKLPKSIIKVWSGR